MLKNNFGYLFLFCLLLTMAWSSLIDDDPNLSDLCRSGTNPNFINKMTTYTQDFIQKMASEYGPSQPPIFNSFNDPSIKQQLRKNVLMIIDAIFSLRQSNTSCTPQALTALKAIRNIYADDEVFEKRSLPRYNHATEDKFVFRILDSMTIMYTRSIFPGAWFATGFHLPGNPVFSVGSELELPLSEVSNESHYVRTYADSNSYGLGRNHNVTLWKDNTELVQWAVEPQNHEQTIDYIYQHYDSEKSSFLLSKMVPLVQLTMERQLLTVAHAHTIDRTNALLAGSLYISDLPKSNSSAQNITLGQLMIDITASSTGYFVIAVSYDASRNLLKFLTLHVATRTTKFSNNMPMFLTPIQKWVPDVAISDMTQLYQLIVDGKLLDQPPDSTVNLEQSVKKMMTRAPRVDFTSEEQTRRQELREIYRKQRSSSGN